MDARAAIVAQALVHTIRACTAKLPDSYPGRATVSIGVAAFPNPVCTADEILTRSDRAMYEAKQGGRDRFALYRETAGSASGASTPAS
jgi:diguanylate cyclase (GGDEF)-like protein